MIGRSYYEVAQSFSAHQGLSGQHLFVNGSGGSIPRAAQDDREKRRRGKGNCTSRAQLARRASCPSKRLKRGSFRGGAPTSRSGGALQLGRWLHHCHVVQRASDDAPDGLKL